MSWDVFVGAETMAAAMRLAAPLLFAALGELVCERSGVLNIGLEGVILISAFSAFWSASAGAPLPLALVSGVLAGCLLSCLFALFVLRYRADQVVAGMAVNILALGLTGLFYRAAFGMTGRMVSVDNFATRPIPLLCELPYLGTVLFQHNWLVYVAGPIALGVGYMLYRTRAGLALRALGDGPRAADSLGIPVLLGRAAAILFGGMMGGLAGSYLVLAHANTFVEGMSAGRGFIAVVLVILGAWRPGGVVLGAVFFGWATALQYRLQATMTGVPYLLFQMLPYVLVLVVLSGVVGRRRAPRALAMPYVKE
ncbi:ABC transporter permease [bacterium]|nr:ABC transporter permease [bacterium]